MPHVADNFQKVVAPGLKFWDRADINSPIQTARRGLPTIFRKQHLLSDKNSSPPFRYWVPNKYRPKFSARRHIRNSFFFWQTRRLPQNEFYCGTRGIAPSNYFGDCRPDCDSYDESPKFREKISCRFTDIICIFLQRGFPLRRKDIFFFYRKIDGRKVRFIFLRRQQIFRNVKFLNDFKPHCLIAAAKSFQARAAISPKIFPINFAQTILTNFQPPINILLAPLAVDKQINQKISAGVIRHDKSRLVTIIFFRHAQRLTKTKMKPIVISLRVICPRQILVANVNKDDMFFVGEGHKRHEIFHKLFQNFRIERHPLW